jgi:hypothetical protein
MGLLMLLRWTAIIGALAGSVALGGCSSVRLAYANAPELVYWWVDGYIDIEGSQSNALREGLKAEHDWHREQELPKIAEWISSIRLLSANRVSPEQVCAQYDTLETRTRALASHTLPLATTTAKTLSAAQLKYLVQSWDKRNREWHEEWIEGSLQERNKRRFEKLTDRFDSFYGKLSAAQLAALRSRMEKSGWDAALQYQETRRRQQDTLQTLRAIQEGKPDQAASLALFNGLMERSFRSPDAAVRLNQEQARRSSCEMLAELHNSATQVQRTKLQRVLQGYESDALALVPR